MGASALEEKRGLGLLSHLDLKVIAVILMTLDHIAMFFIDPTQISYAVLRGLGRLAFPLFAFMSIEGVFKSHNNLMYSLKLLVLGAFIDVVLYLVSNGQLYTGNSMLELGLGVLAFSLIKRQDKYSFLSILPISIMVLSDFAFFPIKSEYGTFGLLIMGGFYIGKLLSAYYFKSGSEKLGVDLKEYYGYSKSTLISNAFSSSMLVIIYLVFFMVWRFYPSLPLFSSFFSFPLEQYGILAFLIILLYSGRQGFNNKYLNWAFYLYYPLHILLFAIISLYI